MPYAQIAAAPTTRPMPPITAVQRPACPTMAAGMAADVPLHILVSITGLL